MERWVKLYDKFTEWEWFDNSQMVHIFIYLFLRANTTPEQWHGISIERGQLVTTLAKISADTSISMRSVRTCLSRLLTTGEIRKHSTNQRTIITIVNYERYQQPATPPPPTDVLPPAPDIIATAPPPVTHAPSNEKEQNYQKEMLHDEYWQEVLCMRHHVPSTNELKDYIKKFWLDSVCRAKSHTDVGDAKRHFNDWLRKHLEYKQNATTTTTTTSKRRGVEVNSSSPEDYKTAF